MSPRFKGQWRPSLFKLMLMIALLQQVVDRTGGEANGNGRSNQQLSKNRSNQQVSARSSASSQTLDDVDLMEPCYLANNRASESLTISESTPVGTVVGELLVNGDPSTNGNIELSIKMPSSSAQQPVAAQQQHYTNGYSSATKRFGSAGNSQVINNSQQQQQQVADINHRPVTGAQVQRSARDLSSIIELMPPLSIEHQTKRLILAKKLDREKLDRYAALTAAAGSSTSSGNQQQVLSSSSQSGASGSSSAALTVHVKCQLRGPQQSPETAELISSNRTTGNGSLPEKISFKSSSSNSILIPIHLIVTDENDNWPIFINSPYIIDLNETIPIGSPLPGNEIVAVDNDQQGPLSTIEYSIVTGSLYSDTFAFLNPLDSRSLIVKDNHLLDYESQSKLTLKIMAKDQGEPSNWAITTLYINLFDNDDQSPLFTEDRYFGQVKENRPGEIVDLQPRRLLARDADKTINSPILYSFYMKTNQSIHFELDQDLARLSLKKTLPVEQQPFCLLIKAQQADDSNKWTLAAVQLRLTSSTRNELEHLLASTVNNYQQQQLPEVPGGGATSGLIGFAQANYTVEVSELAPPGFTVLNLRAIGDSLPGANQHQSNFGENIPEIHYQLLDDEGQHFKLDQRTGTLTLNKSIDYEMYRRVSVRVLATYQYYLHASSTGALQYLSAATGGGGGGGGQQQHYPNLACDTTRVNVIVINQNDHKPEFSHEQYNLQLSISDLIASFDPPVAEGSEEQTGNQQEEKPLTGAAITKDHQLLVKKFGTTDLNDDFLDPNEQPFGWRAMQLGQVYCADRDFGDKLTLQLTGSKANLFHLTQDGRLYLPLVNQSAVNTATNADGTGGSATATTFTSVATGGHRLSSRGFFEHSRTINNQLVSSKVFFARRRQDHSRQQNYLFEPPDRDYLNYLLGELSNLGRLRLKVIATDDGQPQRLSSSAIIVISIISIDNFIIQRAMPLINRWPHQQPVAADSPLLNQTNNNNNNDAQQVDAQQQQQQRQQVMMIPATNGKSFVQINPDIMSNLIQQNKSGQEQQVSATGEQRAPPVVSTGSHTASATGGSSLDNNQQNKHFQPPSLLLVDDDGAKFVAMPAAIEVYNQQVQEAADLLLARQRQQQHQQQQVANSNLADQSTSGSKRLLRDAEESLWTRWTAHFGLNSKERQVSKMSNQQPAPTGGFLYWINLSSAIMLHLIGFAIILTLLAKLKLFRRSFSTTFGPTLSWFSPTSGGGSGATGGFGAINSAATGGAGGQETRNKFSSSSGSSANSLSSNYTFMTNHHHQFDQQQQVVAAQQQHHHLLSSTSSSSDTDQSGADSSNYLNSNNNNAGRTVSAGLMVKASSTGGFNRQQHPQVVASGGSSDQHELISSNLQQEQGNHLFGHLKLTLNKMLELGAKQPLTGGGVDQIGQVISIKTLDSDSASSFNSFNSTTDTKQQQVVAEQQQQQKRNLPEPLNRSSSTFVGGQLVSAVATPTAESQVVAAQQVDTIAPSNNIVSINVVSAPKQPPVVDLRPNASFKRKSHRFKGSSAGQAAASGVSGNSSSSSVVSLISMSSSISNKINAAVQNTCCEQNTASDASSLDSSTLFSGAVNTGNHQLARSTKSATAPHPPPPPPPPPPPSLVQVVGSGMESLLSLQSFNSTSIATGGAEQQSTRSISTTCNSTKPFSARPLEVQQIASVAGSATCSPSTSPRRPVPQNPVHLRLRQQAAREQQQVVPQQQDKPRASKKPPAPQPTPVVNNSHLLLSTTTNSAQHVSHPPTPPPPPPPPPSSSSNHLSSQKSSGGGGSSTKTVSPTTSVDRGYESFQSYTSSSQQQRKSVAVSSEKSTGNHLFQVTNTCSVNGVGGAKDLISDRKQHRVSSGTMRTAPVVGRQSQRVQKLQVAITGGGNPAPVASQAFKSTGERRESLRRLRSGRTLALAAAQQATGGVSVASRASAYLSASSAQLDAKQQQVARSHKPTKNMSSQQERQPVVAHKGYDTEDEDFYYCYSNEMANAGSEPTQRQLVAQQLALTDYVSHAYTANHLQQQQQPPVNMESSGKGRGRQLAAHSANNGHHHHSLHHQIDLNEHHHLLSQQRTGGGQPQRMQQVAHHHHQQQQQQQYRQQRPVAAPMQSQQSAAYKKQLTWSDQVRIA